jgi:hypothetical protein
VDKLRSEYRQCIEKFKETGNTIEPAKESDHKLSVIFKSDIEFSLYPWLPTYWSSLNAYFGMREGLCSQVLAASSESVCGGLKVKLQLLFQS